MTIIITQEEQEELEETPLADLEDELKRLIPPSFH